MAPCDLPNRIDAALKESVGWNLIDDLLLELCRKYPTHSRRSEVAAKITLIGRTYVTGIERAFKGGSRQGDALSRVVEHVHRNYKAVDAIIADIPCGTDKLTEEAIMPIVFGHSKFVELLRSSDACRRDPRSFASKYLHFHSPIVPIYDSYVAGVISKVVGGRTRVKRNYPANIDWYYASYVEKFWRVNSVCRQCWPNLHGQASRHISSMGSTSVNLVCEV